MLKTTQLRKERFFAFQLLLALVVAYTSVFSVDWVKIFAAVGDSLGNGDFSDVFYYYFSMMMFIVHFFSVILFLRTLFHEDSSKEIIGLSLFASIFSSAWFSPEHLNIPEVENFYMGLTFGQVLISFFLAVFITRYLLRDNIFIDKLAKSSILFFVFIIYTLGTNAAPTKTLTDSINEDSYLSLLAGECYKTRLFYTSPFTLKPMNCISTQEQRIENIKNQAEKGFPMSYLTFMTKEDVDFETKVKVAKIFVESAQEKNAHISWVEQNIPSLYRSSTLFYNKKMNSYLIPTERLAIKSYEEKNFAKLISQKSILGSQY